jgi:hypothetical protein
LDYYDKTPHVCFKAEFASAASAGNELSRILESRLQARFDSVRRIRIWFWGPRLVVLPVGQESFAVIFGRSKYDDDEWILLVGPLGTQMANTPEVMLVCREIHALFATVAGITAIRWYFKGFRGQSREAVATPDELPWTQT